VKICIKCEENEVPPGKSYCRVCKNKDDYEAYHRRKYRNRKVRPMRPGGYSAGPHSFGENMKCKGCKIPFLVHQTTPRMECI